MLQSIHRDAAGVDVYVPGNWCGQGYLVGDRQLFHENLVATRRLARPALFAGAAAGLLGWYVLPARGADAWYTNPFVWLFDFVAAVLRHARARRVAGSLFGSLGWIIMVALLSRDKWLLMLLVPSITWDAYLWRIQVKLMRPDPPTQADLHPWRVVAACVACFAIIGSICFWRMNSP